MKRVRSLAFLAGSVFLLFAIGCHSSEPTSSPMNVVSASSGGFPFTNSDSVTYQADNYRTGWYNAETKLEPNNISTLHTVFTLTLDGRVDAQPLILRNQSISGGTHNVAYVATESNSVYAIDADTGNIYWRRVLEAPIPGAALSDCPQVPPVVGVSSTPTIDRVTGRIYVVSGNALGPNYMLHALSLSSGQDALSPISISWADPSGKTPTFNVSIQRQRAALGLSGGYLDVAFGSTCDQPAAHGYLFTYAIGSAFTLANVFVTTLYQPPPGSLYEALGSIWQSGAAPAIDTSGNIFFSTGNGFFDHSYNLAQSVIRLIPRPTSPWEFQYFTPYEISNGPAVYCTDGNASTCDQDVDVSSGGVMIVPDMSSPTYPRLAIAGGKSGKTYVLNRDSLGGYAGPSGPDNVPLALVLNGNQGLWGMPAYFQGPPSFSGTEGGQFVALIGSLSTVGRSYGTATVGVYQLSVGTTVSLNQAGSIATIPNAEGGSIPVISSFGNTSGTYLLWFIQRPAVNTPSSLNLLVFDPFNLSKGALKSVTAGFWSNKSDPFIVPVVINGKVYVGSDGQTSGQGTFTALSP